MSDIINMKPLAKALRNSPIGRKLFRRGVEVVLYFLEKEKLIDWRKIDKFSMDWEKGVINAGDSFVTSIIGRALSEYGAGAMKDKMKFDRQQKWRNNIKQN